MYLPRSERCIRDSFNADNSSLELFWFYRWGAINTV